MSFFGTIGHAVKAFAADVRDRMRKFGGAADLASPPKSKKPASAGADKEAKAAVPKHIEADTREQQEALRADQREQAQAGGLTPEAAKAKSAAESAERQADKPRASETVARAFAQHRAAAPSKGLSR